MITDMSTIESSLLLIKGDYHIAERLSPEGKLKRTWQSDQL